MKNLFWFLLIIFQACHRPLGCFSTTAPAMHTADIKAINFKIKEPTTLYNHQVLSDKPPVRSIPMSNTIKLAFKGIAKKAQYNSQEIISKAKASKDIPNNEFSLKSKKNDAIIQREALGSLALVIMAIIIPFLAVYFVDGITKPFYITILLSLLLWLPGVVYAIYRILRTED